MDPIIQVQCVWTRLVPELKMTKYGGLCWHTVLESLATNQTRNQIIQDLVGNLLSQSNHNVLVLTKTIAHATKLAEAIPNSYLYCGKIKLTDEAKSARVIVGTISKCGVGVDLPHLTCLILAMDVQNYVLQYVGRVLRGTNDALIIDLVDEHSSLIKHYKTRAETYDELGSIYLPPIDYQLSSPLVY